MAVRSWCGASPGTGSFLRVLRSASWFILPWLGQHSPTVNRLPPVPPSGVPSHINHQVHAGIFMIFLLGTCILTYTDHFVQAKLPQYAMEYDSVPNWVRIVLLVLSLLSFAPQISRTVARKNSSGISTYYVLFNLISATEQFTLAFFYVVNHFEEPDFFVHSPINAGDWINLVQTVVITLLWFAFFTLCLYLPSDRRDGSVKFAIGAYISFLIISVVPVFVDAMAHESDKDRRWPMILFSGIHLMFLNWIISSLNVAAFYYQVKEARSRSRASEQALSRLGLACEVVIFMLLATSWIARVQFPYKELGRLPWQALLTWYQLVGWAAVNTAIFGIGQAILLYVVSRQNCVEQEVTDGETEPLLRA